MRFSLYKPATITLAGSSAALSATSVATIPKSSHEDLKALKSQVMSSSEAIQKNVNGIGKDILNVKQQLEANQKSNLEEAENVPNNEEIQTDIRSLEERMMKYFGELKESIKQLRSQPIIVRSGARLPLSGSVGERQG